MGIGVFVLLNQMTGGTSSGWGGLAMLPAWYMMRSAFRLVAPVRAAAWERRQAAREAAARARGVSFRGLIFSWVVVICFVALGAWLLVDEFSSGHALSFWLEVLVVGGSGALIGAMIHENRKYRRRRRRR